MMVRERLGVGLAALLGVFCFLYRYLAFQGFSNDHFLHLARAQQMLLGEWPIRDFIDPGLPLMYVLSAATQVLFGRMLLSEALLVYGSLGLASALTCWLIVRLTGSFTLAAVLTLLQILVFPRSYGFPKILLYPIAMIAIDRYARAPSTVRAAVLAVVTTVSFLMRSDHGVFIAAGCVAAIIVVHWDDGRVQVLRSIGTFALVTALMLSPYFLYIQRAAGLVPYVRDAIAFSRAESGRNPVVAPTFALDPLGAFLFLRREATINVRWAVDVDVEERETLEARLGLTPDQPLEGRTQRYRIQDVSRPAIERIVRDPAVEDTAGIDRTSFTVEAGRLARPGLHLEQNAHAWLYYLSCATVVAGGVLVVFGAGNAPVIAAVTIMAALAASTFLRSTLSARIADIWGILPLLLAFVLAATSRVGRRRLLRVAGALVLVVTAGAVVVAGDIHEKFEWALTTSSVSIAERFRQVTQMVTTSPDALHHFRETDGSDGTVAAYVARCTRPSDRLLVFSFAPELFWHTQRGFAAGYAAFVQGHHTTDTEQRLGVSRWRSQSVPLAIVFEREYVRMAEAFPIIADDLRRRYVPIYRQEQENGRESLMIFAERGRTVESTYGLLGTPCFSDWEDARQAPQDVTDTFGTSQMSTKN